MTLVPRPRPPFLCPGCGKAMRRHCPESNRRCKWVSCIICNITFDPATNRQAGGDRK